MKSKLVLALATIALFIAVALSSFYYWQEVYLAPTFSYRLPVTFTCNSGSKYAFTVIANVDLNDGMNQAEATMVAEATINHELTSAVHEFKSANVYDAGIWTINFSWGAISPNGNQEGLGHYFAVTINPSDRTVTYSRCF